MIHGAAFLAPAGLVAFAVFFGAASASPTPPVSGDWVLDPGEVVFLNNTTLTIEGNLTLSAGSELHLDTVEVIFSDAGGKRILFAPEGSLVDALGSSFAAGRGILFGGNGFYMRIDGQLVLDRCAVTGLSGPAIPNPFAETEGIHITNASSRVTNSSVSGAAGYAITVTVYSGPTTPTIADNRIENNGGGLFLGGFVLIGADAVVERNAFSLNALPHIVSSGSNPTIRNNTFTGSSAGIVALLGSPVIVGNTFLGNVLNAISITQGGGVVEGNTVTGTGIAFATTTSVVSIRNNTVSLSATFLQASGGTVTFDDNGGTGSYATALLANGSTVNAHNNVLESTLGSAVVRATNGSALLLAGGSLVSTTGPGIIADGGSLTLESATLTSTAAAITANGTAVVLRGAHITGGPTDPVLSLRGGSLAAAGGEISGGDDGVRVDHATSSFNATHIHGNAGYGIRAAGLRPVLSSDEVGSFLNGNGEGDLLYEADLTVRVENARHEAVANATVAIVSAQGGPPLTGLTGGDGRAGPVRVTVTRIDSLNNEHAFSPYVLSAFYAPDARARGAAALEADEEVVLTLATNSAPTLSISGPERLELSMLGEFEAVGLDADHDELSFSWSVDDGRTYLGPLIHVSFNTTGVREITAAVTDGFVIAVARFNVTILTPEQANLLPVFVTEPVLETTWPSVYRYDIYVNDPDSAQPVFLQLMEGPEGMTMRYGAASAGRLEWDFGRFMPRGPAASAANFTVVVRAFDGLGNSYQNFTLQARVPADLPPVIAEVATLVVNAGATGFVDLTTLGSDPDDLVSSLRWRLVLPNDTAGAIITLDPTNGSTVWVQAPSALQGTHLVEVTLYLEDPVGLRATKVLHVELRGQAPPAPPGDSSLLATALSLGALAVAAVALLSRRRPPPETPPPAEKKE